MKVTDAEIMDGWAEYAAMSKNIKSKGKYKVGDRVLYKGKIWEVLEYHGRNIFGQEEYYIQDTKLYDDYLYVTDSDLECVNKDAEPPPVPGKKKCEHKNAYKNIISRTLQFWVCPDCKQEIENPNKSKKLNQKEIDDLLEQFESMLGKP